jgi:hypothetical protein
MRKKKFDLHRAVDELACTKAIVRTGMPNSTVQERRSLRAHVRAVEEDIHAARRSRVFVSQPKTIGGRRVQRK